MIARIRRALVFLFATPPVEYERRRPTPQAHPEPPARSMVAPDPALVRQMADRGYRFVDPGPFAAAFVRDPAPAHYHPDEDPGVPCFAHHDELPDSPDGQL